MKGEVTRLRTYFPDTLPAGTLGTGGMAMTTILDEVLAAKCQMRGKLRRQR
jgi:hypothetical protein